MGELETRAYVSDLSEETAPPKKRARKQISNRSCDVVVDLERCSFLEEKTHDAARCDMQYLLDKLKEDKWTSTNLRQFGQAYSKLFALFKQVWRTRDWRMARTIINLLTMSWKYTTENQISMLEVLFGYLYMTKGLKMGPELLVISGLKHTGQVKNTLAEAARAFLEAGDVISARNAIIRYLVYEREPQASQHGLDEQWPMKTAAYFLRLRIIAGLIDLAKKNGDKDMTKYDVGMLLQSSKRRHVIEVDSDDDDPTPESAHLMDVRHAEVRFSNMILDVIREHEPLVNPPWHSFVLLALERCTHDPTLALLKLAAKDFLTADSLLAMKSHVLKFDFEMNADAGTEDPNRSWYLDNRRDELKSINYALNRACPLEPYDVHADDDAQAAFLDSTWEDLNTERVQKNFEFIANYVENHLCTDRRETRKYWRKFWVSMLECLPIWKEFEYLPADHSDVSTCSAVVGKMLCLVEGPEEEVVGKFCTIDPEVETFWNVVKEVEACWRGKQWATRNLQNKRATMFESILLTGKPEEPQEAQLR